MQIYKLNAKYDLNKIIKKPYKKKIMFNLVVLVSVHYVGNLPYMDCTIICTFFVDEYLDIVFRLKKF